MMAVTLALQAAAARSFSAALLMSYQVFQFLCAYFGLYYVFVTVYATVKHRLVLSTVYRVFPECTSPNSFALYPLPNELLPNHLEPLIAKPKGGLSELAYCSRDLNALLCQAIARYVSAWYKVVKEEFLPFKKFLKTFYAASPNQAIDALLPPLSPHAPSPYHSFLATQGFALTRHPFLYQATKASYKRLRLSAIEAVKDRIRIHKGVYFALFLFALWSFDAPVPFIMTWLPTFLLPYAPLILKLLLLAHLWRLIRHPYVTFRAILIRPVHQALLKLTFRIAATALPYFVSTGALCFFFPPSTGIYQPSYMDFILWYVISYTVFKTTAHEDVDMPPDLFFMSTFVLCSIRVFCEFAFFKIIPLISSFWPTSFDPRAIIVVVVVLLWKLSN